MLTKIEDISIWLKATSYDKKEKQRREAIHILLDAIASSEKLNAKMAMKGGVLLAIKYSSSRYTIDVDFSSSEKPSEIDTDKLKKELDKNLIVSSERFDYGMGCLVQKIKKEPNDPKATAPTFRITIGYAYKTDRNNYRSLKKRHSSTVIKIDYSFNEIIHETEELILPNGKVIRTYSYADLISEKYRALLQQEFRNRMRGQDVYDIYYVLTNFDPPTEEVKAKIVKAIIDKSASRNLSVSKKSMSNPEIKKRAYRYYDDLKNDIYGDLPDYETAYHYLKNFYEGLPWNG
jgi:predicted nucleotidyltransferase component of viral defense system